MFGANRTANLSQWLIRGHALSRWAGVKLCPKPTIAHRAEAVWSPVDRLVEAFAPSDAPPRTISATTGCGSLSGSSLPGCRGRTIWAFTSSVATRAHSRSVKIANMRFSSGKGRAGPLFRKPGPLEMDWGKLVASELPACGLASREGLPVCSRPGGDVLADEVDLLQHGELD